MPSRRAIRSVLQNFLGTYASRNSDHNGYWIFGFVVAAWPQASIDLLGDGGPAGAHPHEAVARRLACSKFKEQMARARVPLSALIEARLEISRSAATRLDIVNGRDREGHDLTLTACTTTAHGRTDQRQTTIFVAPHDPELEQQSTRGRPRGAEEATDSRR